MLAKMVTVIVVLLVTAAAPVTVTVAMTVKVRDAGSLLQFKYIEQETILVQNIS